MNGALKKTRRLTAILKNTGRGGKSICKKIWFHQIIYSSIIKDRHKDNSINFDKRIKWENNCQNVSINT